MDDEKRPVGIYIGPGASNVRTEGNTFVGYDNPIVDHGKSSSHTGNLAIAPQSVNDALEQAAKTQDSDDSPAEHWYKQPIGVLGLSVAGALLSAAALWAFAHYFS